MGRASPPSRESWYAAREGWNRYDEMTSNCASTQARLRRFTPSRIRRRVFVFCETADSCVWQDELQRRYRMMEADRKLYADEVQNVVRKQKSQIEKLKRENAQLRYGSCTATSLHPSSSPPPSTPYTLAPQPSSSTIRPRPQVGAAAAAARLDRRRRLGGLCQGDAHAGLNRSDHSGD